MMKGLTSFVFLVIMTLCWARLAEAETSQEMRAIQEEIKILKEEQSEIQKDLQDMKSLLGTNQAQPEKEFKEAVISIKGAPFKGDEKAKIVMLEFLDLRCSWCRGYVHDIFPQVENGFIKTGKVKYVFFDFPLNSTSWEVAEAANCAGDQGKFWQMHDRLFANQRALSPTDLVDHAEAIGLDMPRFRECIERHKCAARIAFERSQGYQLGVNGVPTFFLGFAESGDSVSVVKMLVGLKGGSFEALKDTIEELLSSQKE